MGQGNNNTEVRKGKHIDYEKRVRIETLFRYGLTPNEIGKQVSKSRRSIERELKKGMVELKNSDLTKRWEYSAVVGQEVHDMKCTGKGPPKKIGKDHKLVDYIEKSIKEGYSPYATLQNIKNLGLKFETTICEKTLYNYIDENLFLNISNKDLLLKGKRKKQDYKKVRVSIKNTKGTGRPKEIESRLEYGHWEMDTVESGKGKKGCLLVLTERKTREELVSAMKSKTQNEVIRTLNEIERKMGRKKFSQKFKTITMDNGSEFLDFERIERSLFSKTKPRIKVYYAHPYSAWERGSNENLNKMIRRFIPKGADISKYSKEDIARIKHWINNYPRKILGGLSANMAVKKEIVA